MDDSPQPPADDVPPEQPPEFPAVAPRRKLRYWIGSAALALALLAAAVVLLLHFRNPDSDGDGLSDAVEAAGWTTAAGVVYQTDPNLADTDGDGLTDGEEAGELVSDDGDTPVYTSVTDPTSPDSDDDGLPDPVELAPWTTADGSTYQTDPMVADTDGDGLTDSEEAGDLVSDAADSPVFTGISDPTTTDTDGDGLPDPVELRGWTCTDGGTFDSDPKLGDTDGDGLLDVEEAGEESASGTTATYACVSNPRLEDSDDDGLSDFHEVRGWRSQDAEDYTTEPLLADTDSDGLPDGVEAGEPVTDNDGSVTFALISDPTMVDSDGDELDDLSELDLSLDPFDPDTDGDGLTDYQEVEEFGTAPDVVDTDGDGFDDAYEVEHQEDQGLDPLVVDEKVDAATYARDFARGFVLGELSPGDSLAWFAGNLVSGGSSFIPGVGWIAGTVSDVRDTIGLAIQQDWVGAGYSAVGLVPTVGDAAAAPAKAAAFVARHPELLVGVGAVVASAKWLPDKVKVSTLKRINTNWDELTDANVSEAALVRLQSSRQDLDSLAEATQRAGRKANTNAPFMKNGKAGEEYLEGLYADSVTGVTTQVTHSTAACVAVCNKSSRRIDVLADGVAHESKVGYKSLTSGIRRQIESDAYLVETGQIEAAHWHFFASDVTGKIGPSKPLLDFLDEKGIQYTIHLPDTP